MPHSPNPHHDGHAHHDNGRRSPGDGHGQRDDHGHGHGHGPYDSHGQRDDHGHGQGDGHGHGHGPYDGHGDDHDDFGGLDRDLPALLGRRRALQLLGGASLIGLVAACGSSTTTSGATTSTPTSTAGSSTAGSSAGSSATSPATSATAANAATSASAGAAIPSETQGPYPDDGSNGPNILGQSGIVRADITTSIGSLSGTAPGVPMTLQLNVVNAADGSPVSAAAVYVWHCTADGRYSVYEVKDQNYLRGVQGTDSAGKVAFTTVFPGCYQGRWPHVHFEIYRGLDQATAGSKATKTSQLALPEADCKTVYTDGRYGNSSANLSRQTLASDNVFSDGWTQQLATVSGSTGAGYLASLLVRI